MKRNTEPPMPCVSAVAVGASDADQLHLEEIFHACGWNLSRAHDRREVRAFLTAASVSVVIADLDWNAGEWKDVLEELQNLPEPPALVVTSRLADDGLWAEVLNMGGYDVLARPLDSEEVTRVVGAAARQFDHERQRRKPARAVALMRAAG